MRLTNNHNVPLGLAVWLAHDEYDYDDRPNYLSVTTLIRPIRQLVLGQRASKLPDASVDVLDLLAGARGDSFHSAIENAWKVGHKEALARLGYPQRVIDSVEINPVNPGPDTTAVYIEQRAEKEIDGMIVAGKFDMILDGVLTDNKSTSTFTYTKNTSEGKWQLQGSIYRWLNPDKVTDDYFNIQYVFVDWRRSHARGNPNYPGSPVLAQRIPLLSYAATETYVRNKIAQLKQYMDAPELDLPLCTEEDLWRDPPVYKYYADPLKTKRSTKNFDNLADANAFHISKGKGIVKEVLGEARACNYCPGRALCSQYLAMYKSE